MTNSKVRFYLHLVVFVLANSAILKLVPAPYAVYTDAVWNALQLTVAFFDQSVAQPAMEALKAKLASKQK